MLFRSEDIESIENVIRFVKEKGGISYAEKVMNEYKEKALNILNQFPETESREAMRQLVIYSTERKK